MVDSPGFLGTLIDQISGRARVRAQLQAENHRQRHLLLERERRIAMLEKRIVDLEKAVAEREGTVALRETTIRDREIDLQRLQEHRAASSPPRS